MSFEKRLWRIINGLESVGRKFQVSKLHKPYKRCSSMKDAIYHFSCKAPLSKAVYSLIQ